MIEELLARLAELGQHHELRKKIDETSSVPDEAISLMGSLSHHHGLSPDDLLREGVHREFVAGWRQLSV